MKKFLAVLPLFTLIVLTSCSETEEKPLFERNADVRDYLEQVHVFVEEYLELGVALLDLIEARESGEMDVMEKIEALAEMGETAKKISNLSSDLQELEELRSQIEKNLDADDVVEFALIIDEEMRPYYQLAEQVEKSDYMVVRSAMSNLK